MKRKEFIRQCEVAGCILLRHGAKHDIYMNLKTGRKQPVPRHRKILDVLAKHIKNILD